MLLPCCCRAVAHDPHEAVYVPLRARVGQREAALQGLLVVVELVERGAGLERDRGLSRGRPPRGLGMAAAGEVVEEHGLELRHHPARA